MRVYSDSVYDVIMQVQSFSKIFCERTVDANDNGGCCLATFRKEFQIKNLSLVVRDEDTFFALQVQEKVSRSYSAYRSKLELKSNSSKVLPVNCKQFRRSWGCSHTP